MSDYRNEVDRAQGADGTWFRVVLEYDDMSYDMNPRTEYDGHAGVIDVVNQSRHNVPQEGDSAVRYAIDDHDFRVVARWLRMFHGATVVLPIHTSYSGNEFNISTGEVDDTPEAGDYIGVTYDTPDTRKVTGLGEDTERTAEALKIDVSEYRKWAAGEVYSYDVQMASDQADGELTELDWNPTDDSCCGLIGDDYAEEAAKEALAAYVAANPNAAEDAINRGARFLPQTYDDGLPAVRIGDALVSVYFKDGILCVTVDTEDKDSGAGLTEVRFKVNDGTVWEGRDG